MKTKSILLLCAISLWFTALSQDQFFFNTNQSLLFLNPSFAGSNGLIRNQSICKVNNPGFGVIKTYGNAFDAYIPGIKAGVGLSYLRNDFYDFIFTNHLALTYAQHFTLKEKGIKIIPSVQFAYADKKINTSWVWPGYPGAYKTSFLDFSSGLLVSYHHFYFGFSVLHINRMNEGITRNTRLSPAYSAHISYNKSLSEKTLLNLSARLNTEVGFQSFQSAANVVLFNHLITGIGIKKEWGATFYGNIGYRHDFISAVISYGSYVLKTPYGDNQQLEFMLSYNLRNKETRKTLTAFETW